MLTLLLAQNGDTALMLACANEQEAAAGELMEATKRAGALDLQVGHAAWLLRGAGRGGGRTRAWQGIARDRQGEQGGREGR